MQTHGRTIIKAAIVFALGFVAGVLFQRYYTVDALLRDVGLRTQLTDQLDGRKSVQLPRPLSPNSMVALAFGQSNSANFGNVRHRSREGVYNYFKGKFYAAQDPMIGADGMGGSVWTWLGDALLTAGDFDIVIFATLGVGASEIARWAPGGDLHTKLLGAVDDLLDNGLTVTHLLWHQGETDARLGTTPEQYTDSFLALLKSLRARGVKADIYVSVATRCYDNERQDTLRRAQKQLPDMSAGILPGPDTDSLGPEYRYDNCHFSGRGLQAAASLWYNALLGKSGTTGE